MNNTHGGYCISKTDSEKIQKLCVELSIQVKKDVDKFMASGIPEKMWKEYKKFIKSGALKTDAFYLSTKKGSER